MNNLDHYKKATVVIVTFKSNHIIDQCLSNLDENYHKILVENSNDTLFTNELKKKYKNLDCINTGYDAGFGPALNRGIELVKTDYIISINPDSFPQKDCFKRLIETANDYSDVAMVTPVSYVGENSYEFDHYGYFEKKNISKKDSQNRLLVDWVNANVCLIKKDVIDEVGGFDENIFLEFDETELQKRIYNSYNPKKKIIIDFNAKSKHLAGKSADQKYAFQMKCEASWHHTWSKYYYYKKYYGISYSLYINLPQAVINILKSIIFKFLGKKNKSKIYRLSFLGFYNSFLNKKSFYRAEID